MFSYLSRGLLSLGLLLTLAACDAGRSDLEESPEEDSGSPPEELDGTCSAIVDGRQFVADGASARVDAEGTLDFSCAAAPVEFLFRLKSESEGPAMLPLGVPGNRVQYRVGQDVTISVEPAGTVVLETYTPDRIVGTFEFVVPGFEQDDDPIRVTFGAFDIEMR